MDNNRIQGLEPGRVIASKNARALGFDYKGEKLWAVIYGPGNYSGVGAEIEQDGLSKPSFGMTIACAHLAFLPLLNRVQDTQDAEEVRKIINQRWLFGFTSLDYREGSGCFCYEEDDRAAFIDLSTKELEARMAD